MNNTKQREGVEHLLLPRYKVIAPYPGCLWNVGQIIPTEYHPIKKLSELMIAFYKAFPHLFKELAWYEDREESELPEYTKYDDISCFIPKERVCLTINAPFRSVNFEANNFLPATKEEFEKYTDEITKYRKDREIVSRLFEECFTGTWGDRKLKVTEDELREWIQKNVP